MYLAGGSFPNTPTIREYLILAIPAKPSDVTWHLAAAWDRQARYELADVHVSVTNPVPQFAYERVTAALPGKRVSSRRTRLSYVITAVDNLERLVGADAAQVDADPLELTLHAHLRGALALLVLAEEVLAEKAAALPIH